MTLLDYLELLLLTLALAVPLIVFMGCALLGMVWMVTKFFIGLMDAIDGEGRLDR